MSDRAMSAAVDLLRRPKASATLLAALAATAALSLGLGPSDAANSSTVIHGPEAKLIAPPGEESGSALAGFSTVISGDGNTALVGAPADNGYAGAAWVLVRSDSGWVQQGPKLTAGEAGGSTACEEESAGGAAEEASECGFGRALAISADGSTALVGAPRQDEQQGAVWVFTRTEGSWSRTAELKAGSDETTKARFGRAVALSADGTTAVISAPGNDAGRGRVWAFTRSGTSWSQQGESFVGNGVAGEAHFGGSLALSGDGTTALIGAPGDSGHVGAAWIFKRSGEGWAQQGSKLAGAGASGEAHFGDSVSLSDDGATALIGARGQSEGTGAAWVFVAGEGGWSEQGAPLSADDEAGEELGYSVALSADGNSAFLGAPHDHSGRGSAWMFSRSGATWGSLPERFEGGAFEVGKAWFGASVALSADARSALVGAPADHGKAGAAFVFGPSPSVIGVSPGEGPSAGGTTVTISGSNLAEATAVHFGSSAAASFTVNSSDSITAVSPPGRRTVDITVQSPYGTSLATRRDRFTYVSGGAGHVTGSAGSTTTGLIGVLGLTGTGGGCGVTLLGKKLAVLVRGRAVVRLRGSGLGSCAGKLRLRVKLRAHGHTRIKTIGTAVFAVAPAKTTVVRIKLNAAGRTLLAAGHGHLNASLLLVRSSPTPLLSRTASVRLARAKAAKVALPKKP